MKHLFAEQLKGYVRIQIRGTSYDRFLNLCAYHHIRLWKLLPEGDAYGACLTIRDFRRLKAIVRKSHVRIRITGRHGLPFFILRYRKRRALLVGAAAAFLLLFWLSSRIWNITIDGNFSQTDDVLFEYLETEGIHYGMAGNRLDCRKLASQIRNAFPEFSWVAAKKTGTMLQIQVREGIFRDGDREEEPAIPSGLAAAKDGTVVSILVRKGVPQVAAGEEVQKGQLLVSGAIPIHDDGGGITGYQYTAADADIMLQTTLTYRDTISKTARRKRYTGRRKQGNLLRIGSLPLALPFSAQPLKQYDVTGVTHQLRLLEHFYLPLYWKTFTVREYEYEQISYTKEEMTAILNTNLQIFLQNLKEKGVQIFQNDVKIEWTETSAAAVGTLTVGEPAVSRVEAADMEEELP